MIERWDFHFLQNLKLRKNNAPWNCSEETFSGSELQNEKLSQFAPPIFINQEKLLLN
jgi:hypothetical protein